MRIIGFLALLLGILKEVHSLKCHVNKDASEDPVPTDCKTDEICTHQLIGKLLAAKAYKRSCMPKEKDGITHTAGKCTKPPTEEPICACATDNCNHECTAENCKRPTNGTSFAEECDAKCKAPEGGSGNGDGAKTTGAAATGDGSQRVAESNIYALAFWILTALVTFLLTH